MSTEDDEGVDLEALLASPEETGDYDCTVPPEFAGDAEEAPEGPPQPYDSACSRRYTAVRQSGRRDLSQVGLIVIHCTQSNSARSSRAVVREHARAGLGAPRPRRRGVLPHARQRGHPVGREGREHARVPHRDRRLRRVEPRRVDEAPRRARRAAYKAAVHAKKFGIPIRWLTPAQLKAGQKASSRTPCARRRSAARTATPGRCPTDHLLEWANEFARRRCDDARREEDDEADA